MRLGYGRRRTTRRGFTKARLFIALILAAFAVLSYYSSGEINPITGEMQRVAMDPAQEIAMGLQAAPAMAKEYGGLSPNTLSQQRLDKIGKRLINHSIANQTDWQYDFHVLADQNVVNAFALPGGQTFITQALLDKLHNDDLVAAVMAHEISHVIAWLIS